MFAAYLDAEVRLGRVAASADTETPASVPIAAVHHLFFTTQADVLDVRERVRRSSPH